MKTLKLGKPVLVIATGQTAILLKDNQHNKTVEIFRNGKIETIARDAVTIITFLIRIWLMIKPLFSKKK